MAAAETIQAMLFELQDQKYREFQCRLLPTVDPQRVIGVRTPQLRALAKKLSKTPEASEFTGLLPHQYYDENNLHGFLIEGVRDFDEALAAVEAFLPCVDNWATCDLLSPKAFKRRPPELVDRIKAWMASGETYTVRFGIEMLMSHYLDAAFSPEYPELVAGVRSGEYYVNMMIAWYFATALAKQYDDTLSFIEERRLERWAHNKAIQKAVESYRITPEQKEYLRTLKY